MFSFFPRMRGVRKPNDKVDGDLNARKSTCFSVIYCKAYIVKHVWVYSTALKFLLDELATKRCKTIVAEWLSIISMENNREIGYRNSKFLWSFGRQANVGLRLFRCEWKYFQHLKQTIDGMWILRIRVNKAENSPLSYHETGFYSRPSSLIFGYS